ncbi:hypothetical protein NDU88_006141 [Pleurodeles waltl]|uniref:Uncharacterized protein n=1 Tax=Pleurodeles waltl TaxID=8319 RepID=A0AAV7QGR2_PLEWA|nr:hypothetical protein NDU88_006141 [Pleurodeles waltl]
MTPQSVGFILVSWCKFYFCTDWQYILKNKRLLPVKNERDVGVPTVRGLQDVHAQLIFPVPATSPDVHKPRAEQCNYRKTVDMPARRM